MSESTTLPPTARVAERAVEAFNEADWDATRALLTANSVYHEVGTQRRVEGADAIIAAQRGWKNAMPDVHGTISNIVATGNTIALELTWNGTHTGALEMPSGAIPATGKSVTVQGVWVMEIDGDQVRESRNYFDLMTLLGQIGAIPGAG
jgi:steroid delta-isomerase-like uncharacterized protein